MKNIALAILCVGLCCYQVYRYSERVKFDYDDAYSGDSVAALVAFLAAVGVFLV